MKPLEMEGQYSSDFNQTKAVIAASYLVFDLIFKGFASSDNSATRDQAYLFEGFPSVWGQ